MITVYAPKELRIQRVMNRDQVKRTEVEARISKQMPEEEKMAKADYVIYNDGQLPLIDQVKTIHELLKNKAEDASDLE